MTTLENIFDVNSSDIFPLFLHYADQINHQPAFLYLDIDSGKFWVDVDSAIGGGVSSSVFNQSVLRFMVNATMNKHQIDDFLNDEKTMSLLQSILDGAELVYDNGNYRGKFNDKSLKSQDDLSDLCRETEGCNIFTMDEVLAERYPTNESFDDFVSNILSTDGDDNYYIDPRYNNAESLKDRILDAWAEDLYDGRTLPSNVARLLLEDGRCYGSAWMDELKEFAEAVK